MKPKVEIGQVYRDKDKRMGRRFLKVLAVGLRYAECVDCTSLGRELNTRKRTVSIVHLQQRFELVEDAAQRIKSSRLRFSRPASVTIAARPNLDESELKKPNDAKVCKPRRHFWGIVPMLVFTGD